MIIEVIGTLWMLFCFFLMLNYGFNWSYGEGNKGLPKYLAVIAFVVISNGLLIYLNPPKENSAKVCCECRHKTTFTK